MGYVYTFVYHEDERQLCHMEMRALFQKAPYDNCVMSERCIDPSRSPFMKYRVEVQCEANTIEDMMELLEGYELGDRSFKIIFVDTQRKHKETYTDKRIIERRVGSCINGKADMHEPMVRFGVLTIDGKWYFGELKEAEPIWLKHQHKPSGYSMALNTRTARAIVNIALPAIENRTMLDPCCGIGTVVIEALSMGIRIMGRDLNPLAITGARRNLSYFGYPDVVSISDIANIKGKYDALVLDMPYNLNSKISPVEQHELLIQARRLSPRVVVVSMEPIETVLAKLNVLILDQCELKKGRFARRVYVCTSPELKN